MLCYFRDPGGETAMQQHVCRVFPQGRGDVEALMCQVKVNLCAHVLLNAQRMLDGLNIPAIALSHSSPLWLSVRLLKQLKQLNHFHRALPDSWKFHTVSDRETAGEKGSNGHKTNLHCVLML